MRFLVDKSAGFSVGEPVSNFAELHNKISAGVKCLTLKGIIDITSDYELPSDVHLVMPNGAGFNVESGATLAVNCSFDAGLYQIFYGDGDISGKPKIEAVYPEWFGAKGDGVADDTNAIQKTVSWFPVVYFRPVKYRVTNTIYADRIHLFGDAASYHTDRQTVIYFDGDTGPALFIGTTEDEILHEPSTLSSIAFSSPGGCDVLVKIRAENRCTVTRCCFHDAITGLEIDGEGLDASWFYVEQCIFRALTTGIICKAGGVILGGEFTECTTGIFVSAGLGQMRVMGVKMDSSSTGIHSLGLGGIYLGNLFEGCGCAIKIEHDESLSPYSGWRNNIIGCFAYGTGSGEIGVELGNGTKWNNVICLSVGNLGASGQDIVDSGIENLIIANDRFVSGRYNYFIEKFHGNSIHLENSSFYPFLDLKKSDTYLWRIRAINDYLQLYNLANNNGVLLRSSGDFELTVAGKGLVLTSPSGNKFRLVVDDSGNISTESVT